MRCGWLSGVLVAALMAGPLLIAADARAARAAELDGIWMPETQQAAGQALRLNGMGLRTYSMFRVHIYVAALYLQHPTSDADAILKSDAARMLVIKFTHDVSADRARDAWIEGFKANCIAPCHLAQHDVDRFLAAVPDFRRGDTSTLTFTSGKAEIAVNGRVLGDIEDANFVRAILATFIGDVPPTEPLKRGLLGMAG